MSKTKYWRRIKHTAASHGRLTLNRVYAFERVQDTKSTWSTLDDKGNRWTNNTDQLTGAATSSINWEETTESKYLEQRMPPLREKESALVAYAKRKVEASPDDHLQRGKIYPVYKNDSGTPCLRTGNNREWKLGLRWEKDNPYWEPVSKEEYLAQNHDDSALVELTGELAGKCAFASMTEEPQPTKEVNPMQIKDTTLINGKDITDLTDDEILGHIKVEQKNIEALDQVNIDSKSVKARITTHQANIARLIELMDARV